MVREGVGTGEQAKPERQVEALIVKNTSVAGMLLHKNVKYTLPLSLAKSLRDQGLAIPVPKAVESHPAPPPPPPPDFEDDDDVEDDEEG
ncbi:MAG TPA: hypothetical protein VGR71_05100 [Nitrospira sp.]|nr:hypothetical protein [Nitrospira sp.]